MKREKDKMKEIAIRLAVVKELTGEAIETFGESVNKAGKKPDIDASLGWKIDKRCKVCNSPHRREYEEYYLSNGERVDFVYAYAKTIGEEISEGSFYRHFRNHFNPQKAVEEWSKELFKEAVKDKIDLAEKLVKKFLLLDAFLERLFQRIGKALEQDEEFQAKDVELMKTFLAELRQYARELREMEAEDEA
jgi:hypothetical protein